MIEILLLDMNPINGNNAEEMMLADTFKYKSFVAKKWKIAIFTSSLAHAFNTHLLARFTYAHGLKV